MLSQQNIEALKAYHRKLSEERAKPRLKRRYIFVDGPVVPHRNGVDRETGAPRFKPVTTKRALLLDRSIYTGEILRQWRSVNGCGKGLMRLVEKGDRRD